MFPIISDLSPLKVICAGNVATLSVDFHALLSDLRSRAERCVALSRLCRRTCYATATQRVAMGCTNGHQNYLKASPSVRPIRKSPNGQFSYTSIEDYVTWLTGVLSPHPCMEFQRHKELE